MLTRDAAGIEALGRECLKIRVNETFEEQAILKRTDS